MPALVIHACGQICAVARALGLVMGMGMVCSTASHTPLLSAHGLITDWAVCFTTQWGACIRVLETLSASQALLLQQAAAACQSVVG